MKNLLLLFTLTVASYTYSQITSFDNLPITRIFYLGMSNHYSEAEAITVPPGKLWYINQGSGNSWINDNEVKMVIGVGYVCPAGSKLWKYNGSSPVFNIIEYDLDAQSVASTDTNLKLDNKMQLFPNPTNSRLSLNSEKDYNIEVFDLSGRKIMEAQGNNLDMSNLSKATYIVKAFDKASKETYSYKVIRN